MKKPKDVDAYILTHPENVQKLLTQVREIVRAVVPEAAEVISYSMPAYKLNGMLVWFAAHTNHIGFYPGASGIEAFKVEISKFKNAKGSVQFPFSKPLPVKLIKDMVKFKVTENKQKLLVKKKK